MTGVQLFQILKTKIGEREANALISYLDDFLHDNKKEFHETMFSTFATKADLFATRSELKEEIASVREDLAKVEGRLETKISDVKSDVLRWMFAFFITMIFAILGLYLKK
jgi:hypothetical protein